MFSIDLTDPNDIVITVPQSDLTLISGTLYEHDTEAFRLELIDWEDGEIGMHFPRTHSHNTTVTIAGVVLARTIELRAPYSIEYEDGAYSVRLVGSNNNFFDVEAGILVQNTVQIISGNSAGLQVVTSGSGVLPADVTDIKNAIFDEPVVNSDDFRQSIIDRMGRLGLDEANPLTTNDDNSISFGSVTINAVNGPTSTTQTRAP